MSVNSCSEVERCWQQPWLRWENSIETACQLLSTEKKSRLFLQCELFICVRYINVPERYRLECTVVIEWLYSARIHDDVIKWKHFPRYWPIVRGIHRSPVNYPHKGQWRGALMSFFICARINGWVDNGNAGDLRRHRAHYDISAMLLCWYHDVETL